MTAIQILSLAAVTLFYAAYLQRQFDLRYKFAGVTETEFKTPLWNAVALESDVPDDLIEELVRHSVAEVIKRLTKKKQEEYWNL